MELEELNLKPQLLKAVAGMGYTSPTPIQEQCIPQINNGKDVVGQSSTGSGKTAAFALPILNKIEMGKGVQALILTPTRELCVQVTESIMEFGRHLHVRTASVYGGVGINPQIKQIQFADIVIGTPGRIQDHMERRTINFDKVKFLVLDEADRMLDMGFIRDVERIVRSIPKERQTLLFSATISSDIRDIIHRFQKDPVFIKGETHVDKTLLKQVYYDVKIFEKFSLLVHLIKSKPDGLAMVFCGTRREVDVLVRNLKNLSVHAMAIHGGLTQSQREVALDALRDGKINVLVGTDVAARGLDIKNVTYIYNYDVPKTSEEYVHRIGRTARAGEQGDAVTLLTDRDHDNFSRVLSDRSLDIVKEALPEFERVPLNRGDSDSRSDRGRSFGDRNGRGKRSVGRQRNPDRERQSFERR
jgi:ATP-dependent RNA helicase DeaD